MIKSEKKMLWSSMTTWWLVRSGEMQENFLWLISFTRDPAIYFTTLSNWWHAHTTIKYSLWPTWAVPGTCTCSYQVKTGDWQPDEPNTASRHICYTVTREAGGRWQMVAENSLWRWCYHYNYVTAHMAIDMHLLLCMCQGFYNSIAPTLDPSQSGGKSSKSKQIWKKSEKAECFMTGVAWCPSTMIIKCTMSSTMISTCLAHMLLLLKWQQGNGGIW